MIRVVVIPAKQVPRPDLGTGIQILLPPFIEKLHIEAREDL
jgi:hypothetical protein